MDEQKEVKQEFDREQINDKTLAEYKKDYSEQGLKDKIAKYSKAIGIEVLYKVVQLWYVLQRDDVPKSTKAIIMGALGYLIAPLDFLPDLTPVLGYSDDMVAITFAMLKLQGYINDDVRNHAKQFLANIFGKNAVKNLD